MVSVMMLMTTLSSKIVLTRYPLHWTYFSVNKGPRYCKPNVMMITMIMMMMITMMMITMMMEPCSLVSNTVTATETRHIAHEYRNTTKNDLNDKYRYVNFFSDRFRVVFIIDVSSTGYDDDDDTDDD